MHMPPSDPAIMARKSLIVARLQEVLPEGAVLDDPAETLAYECDALAAYRCPPLCAVLPGSTKEVSEVMRICHEMGVPVVLLWLVARCQRKTALFLAWRA